MPIAPWRYLAPDWRCILVGAQWACESTAGVVVGAFAGLNAVTGGRQVARCRTSGQNGGQCNECDCCHGKHH